jgi:hypothetical protein
MALVDDIARDVASRYAGSDGPEATAEDPALEFSGAAIEAVNRGDRVAFLAAVRSMLEPPDADDYEPELAPSPSEEIDPDVLLGPE